MIQTKPDFSAAELFSMLIICRFARFFACDVPYSITYAKGIVAAGIMQACLLLPIFLRRKPYHIPHVTKSVIRAFALILCADLATDLYHLLLAADAPHPVITMIFSLCAVAYAVSLPKAAVFRASIFLVAASILAFALLPLGGLSTARLICLESSAAVAHPADFWTGWNDSAELALIPVLYASHRNESKKAAFAWISVCAIGLPLLVLYGAMQCGRLGAVQGNPFALLLARVPLSDALRTDGLWVMLAAACAVLGGAFLLGQFCGDAPRPARQTLLAGAVSLTALTILFIMGNYGIHFGMISALLVVLQWFPSKEATS